MTDKEIQIYYKNRIDRVFEYIDKNLESDLSLSVLSEKALYAPYHFHRIFKFITGETLNVYVSRQRIEKSALNLLHTSKTATEIAHRYGFSGSSSFSRAFKKHFGVSPTEFKKQNPNKYSKIRQLKSKIGQTYPEYEKYICIINKLKKWIKMNAKIEVREIQKLDLAGVTHIGVEGIESAFAKLTKWATPKGLLQNSKAKMGRIFFDSFKVTPADKIRMSIILTTYEPFDTEGEINKLTISKGKFIVGRFEITPTEFEKSWTSLFIWMNENGYKKREGNPFEIYHNDFREHPENRFIVDLNIPIE